MLTEEESNGIEDISQNQLERQLVDAEALADPREEGIDERDERQDREHVCSVH